VKVFFKELKAIDSITTFNKFEIKQIWFCCDEAKDLFTGCFGSYNADVERIRDDMYLIYSDDNVDYDIKFRYCPFCGKKIEFIYKGDD
jgi:hypothetical protein